MATTFTVVRRTESDNTIARYYKQKSGEVKQILLPATYDENGEKVVDLSKLDNYVLPFYIDIYVDEKCTILDRTIAIQVRKD